MNMTRSEVEAEYDRRLVELIEWRRQCYIRLGTAEAELKYTEYPVGENQFHVQHGHNACTAAAVAASLYVLTYVAPVLVVGEEVGTMPILPWTTIVNTGAKLWIEYTVAKGRAGFVECRELLACGGTLCATVERALNVVEELAGHTTPSVVSDMHPDAPAYTLRALVERMPARSAAVVTAVEDAPSVVRYDVVGAAVDLTTASHGSRSAGTVSVFRNSDAEAGPYWIYDSHGGADTDTAALLCHCTTSLAASAALSDLHPTGFFSATIFTRARTSG